MINRRQLIVSGAATGAALTLPLPVLAAPTPYRDRPVEVQNLMRPGISAKLYPSSISLLHEFRDPWPIRYNMEVFFNNGIPEDVDHLFLRHPFDGELRILWGKHLLFERALMNNLSFDKDNRISRIEFREVTDARI